jgi:ATP-dependent helicase/nuclease subunit B
MTAWTENVALAFPREALPVRDWLPVLEAGLAALTVGVIPPALDEVLVGAIDRARNPELKLAVLLGFNESIFPATPASPAILTHADREELDRGNVALGPTALDRISRERYLGYIACTRARQRLAVTFARQDAGGRALNPSPFIAHLRRLLPSLSLGEFSGAIDWREAEHAGELIGELIRLHSSETRGTGSDGSGAAGLRPLLATPALQPLVERLAQLREPQETESLAPALAARLYGEVLKSSVSRLEEFAQCPFRFFVHSGLRAGERRLFELDARERGSFQHEILRQFHEGLAAEDKRWRDLAPIEARERVGRIAANLAPVYRAGLLGADDQNRFTARALTATLQDFVETLVTWMRGQYEFDPAKAEIGFGFEEAGPPAWRLDLGQGRQLALCGRVDRIDLCDVGDRSLAVVMDYKSGARKLDRVLMAHGVQLQLPAYLAAVRRWPAEFFGGRQLVPAGVFYVNLRGQFESGGTRTEVLAGADQARRLAYRHSGRFDAAWLDRLDRPRAGDQFKYNLNRDGTLRSNSAEALTCKEFTTLLDQVEAQLRSLGERIYAGAAAVDPYRKGGATPCEYCDYRAVCRLDEWTHVYRDLRSPEEAEST